MDETEWTLPQDVMDALLLRISTASVEERARWWCAMNCWKWPFPEMPVPSQALVLSEAQYWTIFRALGDGGGFDAAGVIWRDRIDRMEACAGPGHEQLPNARYRW